MVGPGGLEPLTSSVSRKRSNQLSYGPIAYRITTLIQMIRPQISNRSQGPKRYGVNGALWASELQVAFLTLAHLDGRIAALGDRVGQLRQLYYASCLNQ